MKEPPHVTLDLVLAGSPPKKIGMVSLLSVPNPGDFVKTASGELFLVRHAVQVEAGEDAKNPVASIYLVCDAKGKSALPGYDIFQ